MSDEIHYPTGFSLKDIISWGNTGMVCLDESSQTVVKSPHGEENEEAIAIERRIYERFSSRGGHPGLLNYYGPYELGIRLELAHSDLRRVLQTSTNIEQRYRWAKQIADTLHFIHSANVIHGDLTCGNILLDRNLNAKVADFGGSSLDRSPLLVGVTASHQYPGPSLSIQADIFALGSALYEIMKGVTPYHAFSEKEIETRYSKGEFPETKSLGSIGDVIMHCWRGEYNSSDAIITDIEAIQQREFPSPNITAVSLQSSALLVTITAIGTITVLFGTRLAHRWYWVRN